MAHNHQLDENHVVDLHGQFKQIVKLYEDAEKIDEDYIPRQLIDVLNLTSQNEQARIELGEMEQVWKQLTLSIRKSYSDANSCVLYAGCSRFLNGLLMLARNIVCDYEAVMLADENRFTSDIIDLIVGLFKQQSLGPYQQKMFRTCFEFLCNKLSVRSSWSELELLNKRLSSSGERNIIEVISSYDETSRPVLTFIRLSIESIEHSDNVKSLLLNDIRGQDLLRHIINHSDEWLHEQDEFYAYFLNSIMRVFIISDGIVSILQTFTILNTGYFQRLSLLKLLDAILPNIESDNLANKRALLQQVYQELVDADAVARPYIKGISTSTDEELIFCVWNTLTIVLDILNILLNHVETKMLFLKLKGLQLLLNLLSDCQKYLPIRNKLSDISPNESEHLNPEVFPTIKTKIISILGLLAKDETYVQNEIRHLHCLEVILSNCIIDRNNPYVRETSIVALKYILKDNQDNQNFVSQLEAKGVATEEALDQAGYETEFVDGKLKLKRRMDQN